MTELYNKYYDILKHIYNIMNLSNNEELKELSKNTIISIVNKLCDKDKTNKKLYEGILVEFGIETVKENNLDKENLSNNDEIQYEDINDYIMNKIYKNENTLIGDEFQNIMINLIDHLKTNDEEGINLYKTKYDKFVKDNESLLDEDKMNEYYEKIYNEYKNETINKIESEENKNNENKLNINNESNLHENIVEEEESKKEETVEEKVDKQIEENKNIPEKGFKIKNIKRTYNSKLKNKALTLLALSGIGIANPLMAIGLGIGGYYLYKKGIKNAKNLIEKNGLKIDENDNLIDSDGKIVTKEDVGRLNYSLVKRELSKLDNNGSINVNYKKNKLTSMLLNAPIVKSIKNKYQEFKENKNNENLELNDMNKGMGIIK